MAVWLNDRGWLTTHAKCHYHWQTRVYSRMSAPPVQFCPYWLIQLNRLPTTNGEAALSRRPAVQSQLEPSNIWKNRWIATSWLVDSINLWSPISPWQPRTSEHECQAIGRGSPAFLSRAQEVQTLSSIHSDCRSQQVQRTEQLFFVTDFLGFGWLVRWLVMWDLWGGDLFGWRVSGAMVLGLAHANGWTRTLGAHRCHTFCGPAGPAHGWKRRDKKYHVCSMYAMDSSWTYRLPIIYESIEIIWSTLI